jgi:hypothetical protein
VLAVLAVAGTAGAVWAPRRWPRLRRLPWLERITDRVCLALWLAIGGGWLSAAVALGPARPPLGALWLWGGLACGVPWWVNRLPHRTQVSNGKTRPAAAPDLPF